MSTILSLRVASFLFISCFFLFSFSSSFFFFIALVFFLFFFSRLYSAVLEQSTEACYSLSSGYCVLPPTSPLLFLPLHVWIRPPTHPPPSPGKVFRNHQRSSSKGFDMCLDWNCLVKRLETGLIIHSEKKKSLRLQIQPVQFCNSAESYPRVYVSWTWKGAAAVVRVEDTEAENDGVCAHLVVLLLLNWIFIYTLYTHARCKVVKKPPLRNMKGALLVMMESFI